MTDNMLTLAGERKQEKEETADVAKAIFKNVILEIEVPVEVKKPPVLGKTLPIVEEPEKELVGV